LIQELFIKSVAGREQFHKKGSGFSGDEQGERERERERDYFFFLLHH
jgi:hypothetical protein